MKKDYYSILWLERNASADDIKKAYRKKAMDSHPDRHEWSKEKEEEFKIINEAYAVLSDAEKKSRYDRFGSAENTGFSNMGGFDFWDIDVESIFSSVFWNMGGFWNSRSTRNKDYGTDIQEDIHISFAESYSGIKKILEIKKTILCTHCNGFGTKDGKEPKKCSTCHGSGAVTKTKNSIFGMIQQSVICDDCKWAGHIIEHPCKECAGNGKKSIKSEQSFEIPAGIDDGMTLKLSSEGNMWKLSTGDLYITCHVEQSFENMYRNWNNIATSMYISPAEAVIGTEKKIKFPIIGERLIKVASGTQHGKKIVFSNEGMPVLWKKWRGDLVITIGILIPGKVSSEQKKLYEALLIEEQK